MYTVYHNRKLMYRPDVTGNDGYVLIDPNLALELNSSGTFTATVPRENCQYADLNVFSSQITVFNGTMNDDDVLWQGRIISIERDFWGNKKITAEGELSFFADYYEPSFERYGAAAEKQDYVWKGTVQRFWELLIAHYNAVIPVEGSFDSTKYINSFVVDASVASKKLAIEQKAFTSGWDMITNELLDQVGGYVWFEWSNKGANRTLHHSASSGSEINQTIKFGENMIDINECISASSLYTAIIAEGPNDDNGLPYTLRSSDVPSADQANFSISGYRLYYKPYVALFGKIEHYEKFDSAVNFADLYSQAKAKLVSALAESMTITVKAADLHYIDSKQDRFALGCMIRCVSKPHGLNDLFRLTAMTIPLSQPDAEEYTLGLAEPAMSIQSAVAAANIEKVSKNALTVKRASKSAGTTSGSASKAGYINIGDELVLAYGYCGAKSISYRGDFTADYSAASFRSTPAITAIPCFSGSTETKNSIGATIGAHVKSANSNSATIQVSVTAGTHTMGVMWIAIGY